MNPDQPPEADGQRRPLRVGERAFAVAMLALSGFLVWQSYGISGFESLSSPGAFPLAVSSVMLIASVIVVIASLKGHRGGGGGLAQFVSEIAPPLILVFIALIIVFALLLNTIGFLPAASIFLFSSIQFLRGGNPLANAAMSVGALLVTYVVFRLVFQVVLPEGIVPEREIIAWIERLFAAGSAR